MPAHVPPCSAPSIGLFVICLLLVLAFEATKKPGETGLPGLLKLELLRGRGQCLSSWQISSLMRSF
jgi:hypothetical protein